MQLEVSVLVVLSSLVSALRRGPHHPHGQPVDGSHHHYQPKDQGSMTGDKELLRDVKHLEEDSVLTPEILARMTPEELEFQYFAAHDFDGNSKLDGLELLKAVYHTIEHSASEDNTIEPEAKPLDFYIAVVDRTLGLDDTDGDGYISYPEYRAARGDSPDRTLRVLATEE
ncbi:multiple coagulation factor deficiency protein 2 homolog [Ostrinia nubilalis]